MKKTVSKVVAEDKVTKEIAVAEVAEVVAMVVATGNVATTMEMPGIWPKRVGHLEAENIPLQLEMPMRHHFPASTDRQSGILFVPVNLASALNPMGRK